MSQRLSQMIDQQIFVNQCLDEKLQIYALVGEINKEMHTIHTNKELQMGKFAQTFCKNWTI